jgi:hypothetical protein
MILLPLMTTWMWFQIFTASPLLSSGRPVEDKDTSDASISLLSVQNVVSQEAKHAPSLFPLL